MVTIKQTTTGGIQQIEKGINTTENQQFTNEANKRGREKPRNYKTSENN